MSLPSLPCQATAVYSWSGEQDSDLGMIEGDRIEVLDYGDGNWWFGRLQRNKMQGVFPKNFVKILEIPQSSSRNSIASSQRNLTKSPSFSPVPSLTKIAHSTSQLQLAHSRSPQFYPDESYSDEEFESSRYGFQSPRASLKKQPKYYSTNDLPKFAQGRSSPLREDYENSSIEYDDDEESPPPPPPKTRSSREALVRPSLTSSPSTNARSSQMYDYSTSSIESPPPKTPGTIANYSMLKNSMQRSGLNVSGYSYQQLYDSMMSTDTERSIQFGHSNFSATSAGSLARHKYQNEQNTREAKMREIQQQGGLQTFTEQEQVDILKKMFVDKKQSRHPKLLKKLFSKDSGKVSLDDQIYGLSISEPTIEVDVSAPEIEEVVDPRIEILNQVTLTPAQKAKREERAVNEKPYSILRPFDGINDALNRNEIVSKPTINIDSIPLYHVDKFIRTMPIDKFESIESIALNIIGVKFQSDFEKVRAIYCFCTERIELIPVDFEPMDRRSSPKMNDIIYKRKATPYQLTWLFKAMANTLQIKTELVLGYFKHPFGDISEVSANDKLIPNHSWLSIMIEGQWRMIDVVMGNFTNEMFELLNINDSSLEIHQSFYFLTKPLHIIHSHIPITIEQQHILPPIDTLIALALPPVYPSYYHYGVNYHKFNTALTIMKDLEIAEFQLQVPPDVEIIARIQSDDEDDDSQALSQCLWHKNKKLFIIRGLLPPKNSTGFLKLYVGDKKTNLSDYMLFSTIQLYHQGMYKPLSFVKRYPTVHTLNQDLLVASPQHYEIEQLEAYEFLIKQHPSFQVDSYNKYKAKTKLALQSPSGKILKFNKLSDSKYYSDWALTLQPNEPGLWRGLVLTDDGLRWSIFCEWNCI